MLLLRTVSPRHRGDTYVLCVFCFYSQVRYSSEHLVVEDQTYSGVSRLTGWKSWSSTCFYGRGGEEVDCSCNRNVLIWLPNDKVWLALCGEGVSRPNGKKGVRFQRDNNGGRKKIQAILRHSPEVLTTYWKLTLLPLPWFQIQATSRGSTVQVPQKAPSRWTNLLW